MLSLSAVSIRLVGGDFVVVTESDSTLRIELAVSGLSFGAIPLRVVAASYSDFDDLREAFGIESTLEEIAGSNSLPSALALPCELIFVPVLQLFDLVLHLDLDFNGTLQTLQFTADLVPSTETISISLYSDGVPEEEEGFVVVFGVMQDELMDERDRGSVDVLQQVVLVTLLDGSKKFTF